MTTKRIALLPGDGIGKEVTQSAKLVLQKIAECFGHNFRFSEGLIGHAAIEKTGTPLPDETMELCHGSDAIFLGAVGVPEYDHNTKSKVRPEQGLLKLRKELGLFANIRPIQVFEELADASSLKPALLKGVDILFFRELTGGIYFGEPRQRSADGQVAIDTMIYSRMEIERIAHKAFESARQRKKILHSVDKANVLESSRLWREVVNDVSTEYPEVKLTHLFVDNAAMQLAKDPRQFDVVLSGNLFGDILTDLGGQIAGSLGLLPSASVGYHTGVFEPIHGAAHDIAGKNIANPIASILSAALLLSDGLDLPEEGRLINKSIQKVLLKGFRTVDIADENTPDSKQLTTSEMTNTILTIIEEYIGAATII